MSSDAAWKRVKALKDTGKARDRHLTVAECQRVINCSDAEFRPMVQAGLLTGARYGGLTRLRVADFNPDAGTLRMTTRKGSTGLRTFYVHLTIEGVQFFRAACAKRQSSSDHIFLRDDGTPWERSNQHSRMVAVCKQANIYPRATFNTLRHTWASLSVMAGMPLTVVAGNLGHTTTAMVERAYGHLAPSYRAEQVAKFAPTFGIDPGNVTALR